MRNSAYIDREGGLPSLFYTRFIPKDVRATLLIIHGMQEHSGRYREVAEYFCNKGIAVLTYDHIGHGKSAKTKEELGYFQKENPAGQLVLDARNVGEILMTEYPQVPHFVLGHSMGSFVTRSMLQEIGNRYAGAVIVGTGGRLFGVNILKAYFSFANWINAHRRIKFNQLFNSVNNRFFKKDQDFSEASWLSLNPENRKSFIEDQLCGVPFTNNGFLGLFSIYERATNKKWWRPISKDLPFLFVSGEDDPIGAFGKGVKESANDLKHNEFKSVELKLYPKMRHEILNEDIRDRVYEDIYNWLLKGIENK